MPAPILEVFHASRAVPSLINGTPVRAFIVTCIFLPVGALNALTSSNNLFLSGRTIAATWTLNASFELWIIDLTVNALIARFRLINVSF